MRAAGVELRGARALVVGLGKSGLAAVELLVREGASTAACDMKPAHEAARLGAEFVAYTPEAAANRDIVIASPGVSPDTAVLAAARAAGVPIIGDLELAAYFLLGPAIAITGSNGKTTTTALCFHILRECGIEAQVGGNIGTAPASMVASSRADRWNVLEVSSFQAETLDRFRAAIAVCTNLTPDHLDRHGSMEAYAAAKGRLFATQDESGRAVLNADDPWCVSYARGAKSQPFWFSASHAVDPGAWSVDGQLFLHGKPLLRREEIPLRGMHNVENVLAASAAAYLAGAPEEGIAAAVRVFPGVEHRLEFVRRMGGVDYFNDSKATNVDAALKALDAFDGGVWIILGGKDKGGEYAPLRDSLTAKAKAALLVGAAGPKIGDEIRGAVETEACGTIAAALEHARRHARPGDTVLLAPACASFDQFDNFEHRGRVFKEIVRGWKESE